MCYFATGQAQDTLFHLTLATACELHMVLYTLWINYYSSTFILVPSTSLSFFSIFKPTFLMSPN